MFHPVGATAVIDDLIAETSVWLYMCLCWFVVFEDLCRRLH